ncbi:hypothetical protein VNO77_20596 [Canavalia gladiata]|uniref:Uncharacterized protein n=1 Tax=Canavalia gladiata TaxID=3824 RepID=A0AAN9LPI8_CANGL
MNSTHFNSIRDQVPNLFKELAKNISNLLTLLIGLISATNSDTGKSLFMKNHKLMMCLILSIVLYSFLVMIGTIVEIYNRTLLPIIVCGMLIVAGAVSVMALTIISSTVAWITMALWVGMFTLVAYGFVVSQRS